MKTLSYIVPAYNEEKTLSQIIQKVLDAPIEEGWEKEIIIVNDCSKDKTADIALELATKHKQVTVITNDTNKGKTQTVKAGILASKGEYVVIQDADLEYDPNDISFLFQQLLKNKYDVAYGNRFGVDNGVGYVLNFYGNIIISFISSIFTSYRIGVIIPDMEVCYKLIKGEVAREIAKNIISTSNFGFEPEITAKLSRFKYKGRKLKFIVLPIKYYPRTIEEGKKMHAIKDGVKAVFEILRFNLF